jgi:hypothetical protein
MDQQKQDIVNRIMKLLELGNEEKNSNPHERELAQKKAAKLMAEHAIDFADLRTGKPKANSFIRFDVDGSEETHIIWEDCLAAALSHVFDCQIVNTWKTYFDEETERFKKKWILSFVGAKYDIDIVVFFFKYLRRCVGRMSEVNVKMENLSESITKSKYQLNLAQANYCFGMIRTIDVRLQELYKKREEYFSADTKALMIVKKDALEDYLKSIFPNLKKNKPITLKGDLSQYRKGQDDGKKVNLSRPIEQNQDAANRVVGQLN